MPKHILTRGHGRALTRHHKIAAAGVAALGAAAIGFSAVPSNASTTTTAEAPAQTAKVAYSTQQIQGVKADVNSQLAGASVKVEQIAAKKQAAAEAAAKKKAAAEAKAAKARQAAESASRSTERAEVKKASPKKYGDNLDGWIREAMSIMKKNGIPGSYEGIHRNIMRESSGNPKAINLWDINAQKGIPSKGLLQVIPPTFEAYHVKGTPKNIYDPVANIVAACNYAADKYGTMDNVDSAY
ncbi:transglycosylase SLT domain-containing protein [Actinospica acidiphila]|uniref:transglycosylase SLT domain-containing protein n=1 Tax=unclassified Streptomyces TaxID=2593676 RepID=UPI0012EAE84F|nr:MULTISPECIES: transglycosylase SLT domain-containing protein [unclassified Streptomyces]MBQ0976446.1 transglycosylase SLT domain-containing protein [Streptomyces sp. RK31]MUT93111.1 transglycosylase SLT domain-containing protein [Streptomyces sp. Z38]NEA84443.1 transglycosylase SLT domain-containing protein [Actinospica acidiphila]